MNVPPTPTFRRTLTPLFHGYRTIRDYLTNTAGLFSTRNVLLCAGTCKLSEDVRDSFMFDVEERAGVWARALFVAFGQPPSQI